MNVGDKVRINVGRGEGWDGKLCEITGTEKDFVYLTLLEDGPGGIYKNYLTGSTIGPWLRKQVIFEDSAFDETEAFFV